MAKMRVHELAKELGIENKQIIEFLSTTEHAVKSHSSSVEDDVQAMVRKQFGKGTPAKAAEPVNTESPAPKAETEAPKTETAAPKADNADRPKKKSSITAVFNAQYSKQGGGHGNNRRPNGQGNGRPNNGDRRPNNNGDRRPMNGGRPEQRQAKPASDYDVRKAFERAINPEAAKAAEEAERAAAAAKAEAVKAA